MALSSEDKKDVKGALGKAMANKVSKVTRDDPQAREDAATAKMMKRYSTKSKGARMSRSFLG